MAELQAVACSPEQREGSHVVLRPAEVPAPVYRLPDNVAVPMLSEAASAASSALRPMGIAEHGAAWVVVLPALRATPVPAAALSLVVVHAVPVAQAAGE